MGETPAGEAVATGCVAALATVAVVGLGNSDMEGPLAAGGGGTWLYHAQLGLWNPAPPEGQRAGVGLLFAPQLSQMLAQGPANPRKWKR